MTDLRDEVNRLKEDFMNGESFILADGSAPNVSLQLQARKVLKGHFGKIYAMHWAGAQDRSSQLVSASQDGKLIIWNGQTGNKINAVPLRSSWVMTCAFSPEGKQVACGGLDNLCSIYSSESKEDNKSSVQELSQHEGYLSCCRFLSESKILTSSGDSTCILWDIPTKTPTTIFTDHTGDVMTVSIQPDSPNLFVSGSCDSTARLWDLRQNKSVMSYIGHESDINSVHFMPNGLSFGTGSDDSSCRLYDVRSFRQLSKFASEKILCGITSVAFSSTGRFLFAGYDDSNFYAWDTLKSADENQVAQAAARSHENRVSCLGVSKDGMALCTGSWDNTLKIWA